jgi:hypothetical protein
LKKIKTIARQIKISVSQNIKEVVSLFFSNETLHLPHVGLCFAIFCILKDIKMVFGIKETH